jgi:IS1 family transposase/transposase-like protein
VQTKRLPLESLACTNDECKSYGKTGSENLYVRRTYGKDQIRYLRCRHCGIEFSERRNSPLWNCKLPEAKAVAIAEQLAEGGSYKGTARVVKVSPETVRRLARQLGRHGKHFHDESVKDLPVTALQADERWGYTGRKAQQCWEAEVIDPASRLVVAREQGTRDEQLIRRLLEGACFRLRYPQGVVLFSDGEPSYKTLFPEVFGTPYRPARRGERGRFPNPRYRLNRRQAHVQVVKRRRGRRVVNVEVRYAHGSQRRVHRELVRLGYKSPTPARLSVVMGLLGGWMPAASARPSRSLVRPKPATPEDGGEWPFTTGVEKTAPSNDPYLNLKEGAGMRGVRRPWLLG